MIKKLSLILFSGLMVFGVSSYSYAYDDYDDEFEEFDDFEDIEPGMDVEYETSVQNVSVDNPSINEIEEAEQMSSQALNDYNASGSLFEKITMLEQEKIVVQLEKERAQLDLELDRLNAERIKLQMELDTLSGRADQQQQELEAAKRQLEIQTEKLMRQRDAIDEQEETVVAKQTSKPKVENTEISKKYKLVNIFGVDNQLQATIQDLSSGQNKRVAVGKELDGYVVKSISLNDGIVFDKDGETESLNVGK